MGEVKSPVAFVSGVSNWYWLTVGQGLLSLQQVRVEGNCCYFFCSFTCFYFPLSSLPLFHLFYYLFYLFSPFLWETRVDVLLNPNTIKCQALLSWEKFYGRLQSATDLLGTLWYWLNCWFSYFVLSAWIFASWYQISWFFEVALIDSFFFFSLNFNKGFWLTDNFRQNIHFSVCLKLYNIPSVTREASSVLC